jgi:hypothetical protein
LVTVFAATNGHIFFNAFDGCHYFDDGFGKIFHVLILSCVIGGGPRLVKL